MPRPLTDAFVRLAAGTDGPDAELLERYVRDRDGAAFAELVHRHGPMVLGVCRRALGDTADAEDAFQAVWLVLVRKAANVSPRGMVGNWLYGVATRTAAHLRGQLARRRARQRELTDVTDPRDTTAAMAAQTGELASILDDELGRLPPKYRAAVVLCELEGRAIKDAAADLGVPVGTVASRLARGRAMLAERLKTRGCAASTVATLLVGAASPVSARLAEAVTLLAAAAPHEVARNLTELAHGVLATMLGEKVRTAARFLLVAAVIVGTGVGVTATISQPEGKPASARVNGSVPFSTEWPDRPPVPAPAARDVAGPNTLAVGDEPPRGPLPKLWRAFATKQGEGVVIELSEPTTDDDAGGIVRRNQAEVLLPEKTPRVWRNLPKLTLGKTVLAFKTDGKRIEPDALLKTLEKPTGVVVFVRTREGDPAVPEAFHLALFRADAVILVINGTALVP